MRTISDSTLFFFSLFLLSSVAFASDAPAISRQITKLPLTFETNMGQVDARVKYFARGSLGNFFLTRDGVTMTAGRAAKQSNVDMWFPGSSRQEPLAELATGGVANYFTGKTRSSWIQHVPLYSRVRYHDLFPGTDLIFHGNQDQMEYDFELAPGASPEGIQLAFRGAKGKHLDTAGDLVVETDHGAIRFLAPRAFQEENGARRPVDAAFTVSAEDRVGFAVGAYDRHAKLIIDPVVAYATSFAVSNSTQISAAGVDTQGDLIFTGQTYAPDYPVAGGGKPSGGAQDGQGMLTKLSPAGDTILYSSYIPSSGGYNLATALAVGQDGSAYIAGITGDPNFPVTSQNLGSCSSFCNTGFVAKFDTIGAMVYSTLLGSGQVLPHAITVNAAGNVYVTGQDTGAGLLTVNAFQPAVNGSGAFYAELDTAGTHYVFASYYGVGDQMGQAIALDQTGNVYIAGSTTGDVPFSGQLQSGVGHTFLAKFSPDGSHLLFGSNFGGGIAVDKESVVGMGVGRDGTVYLAGNTGSANFPYLANADRLPVGSVQYGQQMFATAFDPTLTKLKYSTMLVDGYVTAAVLDSKNNFWVAGQMGPDRIKPVNALQSDGPGSGVLFQVGPAGKIATSTYFGGDNIQQVPSGLAVDSSGNLYLAGSETEAASLSSLVIDDGISVGKDPLVVPGEDRSGQPPTDLVCRHVAVSVSTECWHRRSAYLEHQSWRGTFKDIWQLRPDDTGWHFLRADRWRWERKDRPGHCHDQ
jgi:hypothetical protein